MEAVAVGVTEEEGETWGQGGQGGQGDKGTRGGGKEERVDGNSLYFFIVPPSPCPLVPLSPLSPHLLVPLSSFLTGQ